MTGIRQARAGNAGEGDVIAGEGDVIAEAVAVGEEEVIVDGLATSAVGLGPG